MNIESHGIVALIQNQDGKFLLLEERRELMRGAYAPPHGRCESSDESEEDAVIREVKEETNLDIRPIRKLLTQDADTKVRTVSFWLTELIGGDLIPDEAEVASYGWYSIGDALQLDLYPGTKIFFEKLKSNEISLES